MADRSGQRSVPCSARNSLTTFRDDRNRKARCDWLSPIRTNPHLSSRASKTSCLRTELQRREVTTRALQCQHCHEDGRFPYSRTSSAGPAGSMHYVCIPHPERPCSRENPISAGAKTQRPKPPARTLQETQKMGDMRKARFGPESIPVNGRSFSLSNGNAKGKGVGPFEDIRLPVRIVKRNDGIRDGDRETRAGSRPGKSRDGRDA